MYPVKREWLKSETAQGTVKVDLDTPPKTNECPLKMMVGRCNFLLKWSLFRGPVNFQLGSNRMQSKFGTAKFDANWALEMVQLFHIISRVFHGRSTYPVPQNSTYPETRVEQQGLKGK